MPLLDFDLPTHAGDKKTIAQLPGAALALAIAELKERTQRPLLCLIDSPAAIDQLVLDLQALRSSTRWQTLVFPDWETLPYDNFSPHEDIISDRLAVLKQLPAGPDAIILATVANSCHRLMPRATLLETAFSWQTGQSLDLTQQRQQLEQGNYRATDTVLAHGEFAVRGALLDVFPMGAERPVRIELFDNEIESIRWFDPETQRTLQKTDRVELLPAREVRLNEASINRFRQGFRERFAVDLNQCTLYQDISRGIARAGIEYYLPLFYPETSTLFDYLTADTLMVSTQGLVNAVDHYWQEIRSRYESRRHDTQNPILPPKDLFVSKESFFAELKQFPQVALSMQPCNPAAAVFNQRLAEPDQYPIDHRATKPLAKLAAFLTSTDHRVLFCAESAGRREVLRDLLAQVDFAPTPCANIREFCADETLRLGLTVAPLSAGLVFTEQQLTIISEAQLFGEFVSQQRRRRQSRAATNDLLIKNLTELRPGTAVVHLDHGVGRYLNLELLEIDGHEQEFLKLEYADSSHLYVPVTSLHLISRYSGANIDDAPLNKLGNERWQKTKRKAAEKIKDSAAELLDIYARREAQTGVGFTIDAANYQQFCRGFGFEETDDQSAAIAKVIDDMRQPQPMDRLVCGDVGFGKTEVALRAAFIAVDNGYQVAVLVPTTLLAQQHFATCQDRFADWPINVAVLSRFNSSAKTQEVVAGLASGQVDIVVGTHKLLQKSIKFKRLGLLIIDEEHRFGVVQKENLKALRANVDILALTATPIPRTMNMSMSGVRDLSIIATPPARRLSVKTFVRSKDEALIKEAVTRELLRGGQVYFLHNEISTIEQTQRQLTELVPEARCVIAHGQMPERQLERIMSDFYHKRFDLLLCTTIIETGIDVPSANTIIIERADRFGLAQLHQLRGRVGRSHHQAYAYLLTPAWDALTQDAQKRLEAIAESQHLGAGFTLATHDLEIRGAGELLGEEQSGHIEGIGFSLYLDMLNRAVTALKAGNQPSLDDLAQQGSEINLHIPAIIPADYIADINTRLTLYKRIASVTTAEEIRELQVEMIDRFGLLPEPIKNLCQQTLLRLQLHALGIRRLDMTASHGTLDFAKQTAIDPVKIVTLVQAKPHQFRLAKGSQLKFTIETKTAEQRFASIERLIAQLTETSP